MKSAAHLSHVMVADNNTTPSLEQISNAELK